MKLIEWNIHGAAGYGNYSMPSFIANTILDLNPDVAILVEFVFAEGWGMVKKSLEKHYYLLSSPYVSGTNGILIAIKKEVAGAGENMELVADLHTEQPELPNFLQVKVLEGNKEINVLGVRIRDDPETNEMQCKAVSDHIRTLSANSTIICAGDFNIWNRYVKERIGISDIQVYTPEYTMEPGKFNTLSTWSAVIKGRYGGSGKALIDHVIVRNANVCKIEYRWDFVNRKNGYGDLKAGDYKSHLSGLPDHAILLAEIEV